MNLNEDDLVLTYVKNYEFFSWKTDEVNNVKRTVFNDFLNTWETFVHTAYIM